MRGPRAGRRRRAAGPLSAVLKPRPWPGRVRSRGWQGKHGERFGQGHEVLGAPAQLRVPAAELRDVRDVPAWVDRHGRIPEPGRAHQSDIPRLPP